MGFLNPFAGASSTIKLILIVALVALGAYASHRATSFVSEYYANKERVAQQDEVIKEHTKQAEDKVTSDAVTTKADLRNMETDVVISDQHEAQKSSVAERVAEIRKKQKAQKPVEYSDPTKSDSKPAEAPTDNQSSIDADAEVSTIYISTLWDNYCSASGSTNKAQCPTSS